MAIVNDTHRPSNTLLDRLYVAGSTGLDLSPGDPLALEAAQRIAELERQKSSLLDAVNAKQARIDALMLEFCPGEMPAAQRAEWVANQRAVHEPADRLREAERLLRECSEELDFESANAELLSASIGIFLDGAPSTKECPRCSKCHQAEVAAEGAICGACFIAARRVATETLEQRQHELPADAKTVLYGRMRELQRKDAPDETGESR